MNWSVVTKEHVYAAIQKFITEKPEHPEPRSYYLMYDGEKLPSKYIRGLAYSLATGEDLNLKGFNGGVETVEFFKKYGYAVEQVTSKEDDKYSVNEAVWIATALMAAEVYYSNPNATRNNMYFKQADIVHRAQTLVKATVDSARVSWWVNADNEKATQNYLRADQEGNPSSRRLSMIDEFEEKSYPLGLDGDDGLEMNGSPFTMLELLDFVNNVYPSLINSVGEFDIEAVVDYIDKYTGRSYTKPEKAGEQAAEMEAFSKAGIHARDEFVALCDAVVKRLPGYEAGKCTSWINQGQRVNSYFWVEFKKKGATSYPHSISMSINKYPESGIADGVCISLRVEAKDTVCKPEDYEYHNRLVELAIPEGSGIYYQATIKSTDKTENYGTDEEKAKATMAAGDMRKLKVVKHISKPYKNDRSAAIVEEAVGIAKELMPFYDYIVQERRKSEPMEELLFEFVNRFLNEYSTVKNEIFASHAFGNFIRQTVPENVYKTNLVDKDKYLITGSVGQGNWAMVPWLCVFNKSITTTATEGVYVVYLLSKDGNSLYLTFNQGCTDLKKNHGKKGAIKLMRENAKKIAAQIDSRGFRTDEDINLGDGLTELGEMYQKGTIFYKEYKKGDVPEESVLRDDLEKMMEIYEEYTEKENTLFNSRRAWLLTWNPANWNWENYDELCISTKKGATHAEPWTCSSKQPAVGDDVFLMKTGDQPRGIIAHGRVAKTAYDAPHYNPEKAASGVTAVHIDVEFDWIQNFKTEPMLAQDDLKELFPDQTWSPMGSGIEIKDCLPELKELWAELIGMGGEYVVMAREEFDKNLILYGPPGTGKTYNTAIYAVAICDDISLEEVREMPYEEVLERYNVLKNDEKRVAFTTFHQSYGYEEFIEGIKPVVDGESADVSYTIEAGVFKKFCEKAKVVQGDDIEYTGTVWAIKNRGGDKEVAPDFEETLYADGVVKIENINDHKSQCGLFNDIASGDWVVLGRNYLINAIGVVVDDMPEEIEDGIFRYQRRVEWKAIGLSIDCRSINRGKGISNFSIVKSWMKIQDLQKLIDDGTKNEQPYVFIIDEINRGNISKIFGELITLIENTKREGMPEAASAILPYSGEAFSVASNVYILGTMNTADRSIALMDTALRRRFQFVEMMPDADVLRAIGADKVKAGGVELDVAAMLEAINERISFLYDREHTIGHAFFTGLAGDPSVEKLASTFAKSVIPLLQEYFYEDYQKIQLVLGDNGKADENHKFIKDIKVVAKKIFKGSVDDVIDLPEKKYEVNKDALTDIQSYIEIV